MGTEKPSELELQVLAVLWEQGSGTAREVLELLPDGKPRAYTTVLSIMQVMEKKGLLRHTMRGKANVYHPTVERQQVLGGVLKGMVRNLFGGSPSQVLQCLLEEEAMSGEDLAEIQRLIDEHEEQTTDEHR